MNRAIWKFRYGKTYSDTLFDKVVLITFQLCLQAVCVRSVGHLGVIDPLLIKDCLWFGWGSHMEAFYRCLVPPNISSPLRFSYRSFQGVDT